MTTLEENNFQYQVFLMNECSVNRKIQLNQGIYDPSNLKPIQVALFQRLQVLLLLTKFNFQLASHQRVTGKDAKTRRISCLKSCKSTG